MLEFVSDPLKRALDVTLASVGIACSAPIMVAVGGLIAATMGRPVLFRQRRPGLGGVPFELIKFRTMRSVHSSEDGIGSDALRITRLGRFLRSSSLDELPTFFNVLNGAMSLVGPRPLLMQYLDRYTPEQARRHDVRPGITGWAQINGRNALTWEEKFALDVWYVDNRSLLFDLKILALTVHRVLARGGISHEGRATMPEFIGSGQEAEA